MAGENVVGSAEFEIRATTRQLKSDMAAAEKLAKEELKKVEVAAKDAQRELKRAFGDAGHSEFERSMRVIRNASDYTEAEVTAAARRVAADLKGRYRDMGADIGRSLMGVSRTAQIAFAAITAYSLKLAADAGEIESAFEVAFGTATDGAREFSNTLSDEVGRDAVVLREQMTRLQLVLTGTGVAAETSAEMVKALTASGVDAGSLFNTSDAEALQKIISGLTGETEPLKAFGVVITEAAVKAELLRLGFKGNASEASEAAKSIARANLIIEGLSVAQGDAARTADSAANVTKRMTAEFNKAARDLGTQLLPVMVRVFGAATDVLKAFNDLPGGAQVAGLAFLGLIAAGGPIAGLLVNLARVIKLAKETRLALIMAGAGGAGGAGAGAAAGVAGGVAGATAPLAAGALVVGAGTASFAPVPQDVEDYNNDPAHPGRKFLERDAAWRARGGMTFREWQASRSANQSSAQAEAAAVAPVAAQARAAGFTPPADGGLVTGFSLPSSLQTGAGSSGGGRSGSSGRSASDLALMREALDLQNAIDVARTSGNEAQVKALTRQQDLARLTADFQRAGYADAADRAEDQLGLMDEARTKAENMAEWVRKSDEFWESIGTNAEKAAEAAALLSDQTIDRLGFEAELARLGGSEGAIKDAERRLFIETRMLEILRLKLAATEAEARAMAGDEFTRLDATAEGREMAEGMVSLLRSDDIWEEAGRRFKNAAWDGIEDLLAQLFKGMNSGGDGGWLASLGSAIFGGGRAGGGPVSGGMAYRIGEHGPETLMMPSDGFVIPNMPSSGQSSASSRAAPAPLIFDMRGAVMTADLMAQMEALAAASGGAAYNGARTTVPAEMAQKQSYRRGG